MLNTVHPNLARTLDPEDVSLLERYAALEHAAARASFDLAEWARDCAARHPWPHAFDRFHREQLGVTNSRVIDQHWAMVQAVKVITDVNVWVAAGWKEKGLGGVPLLMKIQGKKKREAACAAVVKLANESMTGRIPASALRAIVADKDPSVPLPPPPAKRDRGEQAAASQPARKRSGSAGAVPTPAHPTAPASLLAGAAPAGPDPAPYVTDLRRENADLIRRVNEVMAERDRLQYERDELAFECDQLRAKLDAILGAVKKVSA